MKYSARFPSEEPGDVAVVVRGRCANIEAAHEHALKLLKDGCVFEQDTWIKIEMSVGEEFDYSMRLLKHAFRREGRHIMWQARRVWRLRRKVKR